MKVLAAAILFLCFVFSASAQTQGVIECRDETGIPAWEKPGSIAEIKRLQCGDNVAVLGSEGGYTKIRIGDGLIAFVNPNNVRFVEGQPASPSITAQDVKQREEPLQSAATQAAVPERSTQPAIPRRQARAHHSNLELGIEISPMKFKQFFGIQEISKQTIMEESGRMFGAFGSYTFHPGRFVVRPEGMLSFGTVDYLQPDPTYPQNIENVSNFITEVRGLIGRSLFTSENVHIMPFGGFAYRYRYDGMGGKQNSFGSLYYDRKTSYFYTPIGAEARLGVKGDWQLTISGEYDLFWQGKHINEIQDLAFDARNEEYTQKDGWGARGSIGISRRFGRMGFTAAPFFRYWSIKNSEISQTIGWMEPENQTREWGVRLGVIF